MASKVSFSEKVDTGLTNEEISKIVSVFVGHRNITKAVLYGSRALGTYKPASDIDLTLFGNDISLTQLNQLELELDDLYLPYKIDLSVFNQIQNQDLIDHIQRVGLDLYMRT